MGAEEKKEKEVLAEVAVAAEAPIAVEEVKKVAEKKRAETGASGWVPKTKFGQDVLKGKYASIDEILQKGEIILEPEIVDYLVPNLKQEIIYVGGTPGKGGGIKRTATRITARMHKSGRRYMASSIVVVGNEDGIIGIGKASSKEHRQAIEKAVNQAKLNVIKIKRGCGSWECNCRTPHSIPFRASGKQGSVVITLNAAPRGVGIVADEESKKMLKLAGIKDVWSSSAGQTSTRTNLSFAVFNALKNLSKVKGDL